GERQLDAAIAELTNVDELISGEAARRRVHARENAILGELVVIREFDGEAISQETGVKARLELARHFWFEIGIADAERCDSRGAGCANGRPVGLNRRERVRLLTSLAPCSPQFQRRQQ